VDKPIGRVIGGRGGRPGRIIHIEKHAYTSVIRSPAGFSTVRTALLLRRRTYYLVDEYPRRRSDGTVNDE